MLGRRQHADEDENAGDDSVVVVVAMGLATAFLLLAGLAMVVYIRRRKSNGGGVVLATKVGDDEFLPSYDFSELGERAKATSAIAPAYTASDPIKCAFVV
jgi:LPXTG-motif cell wall-anchored protein